MVGLPLSPQFGGYNSHESRLSFRHNHLFQGEARSNARLRDIFKRIVMFFTQDTHKRDVPTPRAQRQLMVRASLRLSSTSATLMTDEEIVRHL
jgi:hypothetical protein